MNMKIYLKVLLTAAIILVITVSGAYGKSVSIDSGRAFSTSGSGSVQGAVTSGGTASFIIYPGDHTISPAVSNSANGDVFRLLVGTYFDNVVIDRSLSISGAGPTKTTVDGTQVGPVFMINPGVTTTLADMGITGGKIDENSIWGEGILNMGGHLDVKNCNIHDNAGGGILNYAEFDSGDASTTVINSEIHHNSADFGGGILNWAYDAKATLIVDNCDIHDNYVDVEGGGINSQAVGGIASASATIINSNIHDNQAAGDGGGIINVAAGSTTSMTVTNSKIYSNTAYDGGGIVNAAAKEGNGLMTVTNSKIYSNNAQENGGGIYNHAETGSASMTVTNSEINSNTAQNDGGGIFNYAYVVGINFPSAGGEELATLNLKNCNIHDNTADLGGGIFNYASPPPEPMGIYPALAIMNVINSNIHDNYAAIAGGGIYNFAEGTSQDTISTITATLNVDSSNIHDNYAADGSGGGIFNFANGDVASATLNVINSNIQKNIAQNDGGGIFNKYENGGTASTIVIGSKIKNNKPNDIVNA
jgi:hypothetical protein